MALSNYPCNPFYRCLKTKFVYSNNFCKYDVYCYCCCLNIMTSVVLELFKLLKNYFNTKMSDVEIQQITEVVSKI